MKEQDCFNYEPGFVQKRTIVELDNILSRATLADNQRRNPWIYIYAYDNLLNGR